MASLDQKDPPPKTKRPIGLTLAAVTCWFVGIHVVLVPGVIIYLLVQLCVEEGWREILPTPPGLRLLVMIGLSIVSTITWMTAGREYFRSRWRAGTAHLAVALVSGLVSGVLMVTIG